ncbi:hypothetical protein [Caulobacter soli]|uniref:hypothetical protein n=1 Tax=Caulobacter soli TaxID=2708539 RepID=UPI0013ECFC0F|nr:hypothetical protein [Caulobacter soli]
MAFATFTRPDGTPVSINTAEVLSLTPVPPDGPLAGPLTVGTRIAFKNGKHQDVKELVAAVEKKLNAAG